MGKESITLCTVNTRGPKRKLRDIDQLANEVTVLGTCETWLRDQDSEAIQALDDNTQAPPLANSY